jgi:hypothetical protein
LLVLALGGAAWAGAPPRTVVVFGSEDGEVQAGLRGLEQDPEPAQAIEALRERGFAIREQDSVAFAFSPRLWPDAQMSGVLGSLRLIAGRLSPNGLLDLSDQPALREGLSNFFERQAGVVLGRETLAAVHSQIHHVVGDGTRTIRFVWSPTPLPEETRPALRARPAIPSARTIDERRRIQGSNPLHATLPLVQGAWVEVYGEDADLGARRTELAARGMALLTSEFERFEGLVESAYQDLWDSMVANGIAPAAEAASSGPFHLLPEAHRAQLRDFARSDYRQNGFATPEEAEAFVVRATVRSWVELVLIATVEGPPGTPGGVGIALRPPP